MEKNERKVIHLHLLSEDVHEYYGSLANVYDYHTAEEIGITYNSLKNITKRLMEEGKNYENRLCVIRFGKLRQKSGNRGNKSSEEKEK